MIELLRSTSRLAIATFVVVAALSHAQTGRLNDTGMTSCFSVGSSGLVSCTAAIYGNSGSLPHQDARYGRDAANPSKVGGGAAGFDFTRICWNGSPEGTTAAPNPCNGTLIANTTGTASATPATDWACTRDNVTGLVWSLQTQTANWNTAVGATYPDAGHNTPSRCGAITVGSRWRMPARRELLGIVHHGAITSPRVDTAYFPATQSDDYFAQESVATHAGYSWSVSFDSGSGVISSVFGLYPVRLVRNAP
ncbi:MAG TPA: DUF1566 domain-containing protein [Kofleriaceae bacterium]|mgnify:CR=1 FL=1|nr:DUF1566 domain-containing protein [Kofleriaceae bacterium]